MLYGEDDTRKLMDRVDNFTHMLADEKGVHVRVNKFDTAEVELPFSDPEFRKIDRQGIKMGPNTRTLEQGPPKALRALVL